MTRTVEVCFLAFLVRCGACGETARLPANCDVYADWASGHTLPEIRQAEVLVDGQFCRRPVLPS